MSLEGGGGVSGLELGALQGYGLTLASGEGVMSLCPAVPSSHSLGVLEEETQTQQAWQPPLSPLMQESPGPMEGQDLLSCTASEPLTV